MIVAQASVRLDTSRMSFSSFLRLALAAVFVCAQAPVVLAASGRLTIESGGVRRTAYVVEHARLKRALRPTIIVLHGQNGAALWARRDLGLDEALRSRSVVSVYPDAIDGRWNVSEPGGDRDLKFIDDLVAKLIADGISDRHRVFIVGSDTGGILAMRLGCRDARVYAGIAALIALMPASDAASCKPARPIPFLLLAGTADPRAPFNGGKADLAEFKDEMVSADATMAPFAQAAGCSGGRTVVEARDRDRNDGSRVQIGVLQGCKAPVELVKVEGGGHTLPGRPRAGDRGQPVGARNNDVNTTQIVLDFFRRAGGA